MSGRNALRGVLHQGLRLTASRLTNARNLHGDADHEGEDSEVGLTGRRVGQHVQNRLQVLLGGLA